MLGVSPAITAGAVISGAYLGDKLSPLSETTVLTAQMVEVDVYEHIKRQAWTSVPAFVHRGRRVLRARPVTAPTSGASTPGTSSSTSSASSTTSRRSTCCRCCCSAFLSIRKVPAVARACWPRRCSPACSAPFMQPDVVRDFVDRRAATRSSPSIKAIWQAMATGFTIDSGFGDIDRLLVARRHGQHAADAVADHRRGDLRRPARGVRADQPPDRPADRARRRRTGRLFVTVFACGVRAEHRRRRPVHRARAARAVFRAEFASSAASRRPTCRASPPTAAR